MNSAYVLWNLKEAAEELATQIRALESGDTEELDVGIGMAHLYHHLNTAWNARHASVEATDACSEADFCHWRRLPDDLPDNFSGTPD